MKDEKPSENRPFEGDRLTRDEFEALNIQRTPPPAINAPGVVLLLAGTMLVIHACLQLVDSDTHNRRHSDTGVPAGTFSDAAGIWWSIAARWRDLRA